MPITAAIPNYNGREYLERLIPQVREQGFRHIVVLDDASTDGSVEWLATQPDVITVAGKENLEITGNRNRILDVPTEDIILFLDNDSELLGADGAEQLQAEFNHHPEAAVVGPLILSQSGEPMWYNWGYQVGPYRQGISAALEQVARAHHDDPRVMSTVRSLAQGVIGHFEPIPIEGREVGWVTEMYFAVRASVFRQLGGFDGNFRRFHEGSDFCRRALQAGHTVRFAPNIVAKHLDQQSGSPQQRRVDSYVSSRYFYAKHYGVTDESIFRQLRWG
jgi:GT2 family glycosyltransferase